MKIGIFTDCYYPQINGVVTSVLMLEQELIKLGHEVTIVTVKVPNHVDTKDNIIRIPSVPFAKWKEFRLGLPFFHDSYKLIKSLQFDLIHTHTEFSVGFFGKYVAKSLNIPIIHTYHTMYEDYTHYVSNIKHGKALVKKAIINSSKQYVKNYDGVIAPTDKTLNALRRYGVTNNIFVVPTGIDLRHFNRYPKSNPVVQSIMAQFGLTGADKIILSLGRVSEEKSIHVIINQMPKLLKQIPNAKLLVVGDGPYRATLMQLVTDLDLTAEVLFAGQVAFEQVAYYYSVADVFVSASKTETQGLTIMEAMASQVPVVVYDDTNVKDIVIDQVSGRLFETEPELTQALVDCFSNQADTYLMTEKALEIVKSLSKESYARNAENVYYQLLNEQISI